MASAERTRRTGLERTPERPAQRASMKLLVIEDDRETAAYLIKGLSESGYTVDHSGDGREGLFLATSGSYDAIVLDRMLPGMDGLALLGALRGAQIRTPALILSALGSVDDRVKGLRSGGDDYLVKPLAFSELLADRKSTRLNSSHVAISYAVFCLKKK